MPNTRANLKPSRRKAEEQPKLIVFAGPPCSGKSHLSKKLAAATGFAIYEFDEIRKTSLPNSNHNRADRRKAYEQMHAQAEQTLFDKHDVILDAAYFPPEQREAAEAVAFRTGSSLYLIQLSVKSKSAVQRFIQRDGRDHAALDLTPELVQRQVESYPYYRNGLVLHTDDNDWEVYLNRVQEYVATGLPIELSGAWVKPARRSVQLINRTRHSGERINPRGRRIARRTLFFLMFFNLLVPGCGIFALLPFVLKVIGIFLKGHGMPKTVTDWQWPDLFTWGILCLAMAAIFGTVIPWFDFVTRASVRPRAIKEAGLVPRYEPVVDLRPSDASIYESYKHRVGEDSGFPNELAGVPLYFVIPPSTSFAVRCFTDGQSINHETISQRAAHFGLDWHGFQQWRLKERGSEYYRPINRRYVRCTHLISQRHGSFTASVASCKYADYICSDLAVNLTAECRLPDMRRLFEGPAWDRGKLNLSNLASSADYYSLLCSVSLLMSTSDGYVVLARRSPYISEGAGLLGPTAAGAVEWKDFGVWMRIRQRVQPSVTESMDLLRNAALRELDEELGVRPSSIVPQQKCFVGAAFNLLHGRDLNFYVHFYSVLNHRQVSERRRWARDRWEFANLVFVHLDYIDDDGKLLDPVATLREECNRHLRGALYCFAKSGKLKEAKERLGRQ